MFRFVDVHEDEGDRMLCWQAAEGFQEEEEEDEDERRSKMWPTYAFTRAAGCSSRVPQGVGV